MQNKKTPSQLIPHQNVQSLKNKVESINHLINDLQPLNPNPLEFNNLPKTHYCPPNINWLSNIIDRLAHFLDEETPDFIIQSEHGLSQENLEGYSLIGVFSRTAHIKGEVVGYAKKGQEKDIKLITTSDNNSELNCKTAFLN